MRHGFRSILWRIIGLQVFALAAAAVAVPLAINFLLNATVATFENRTLRAHADTIATYLAPRDTGWTLDLPADLQTFYLHGFNGFAYSVIDSQGRVISTSLRDGAPIVRSDDRPSQPGLFQPPKRQGNLLRRKR